MLGRVLYRLTHEQTLEESISLGLTDDQHTPLTEYTRKKHCDDSADLYPKRYPDSNFHKIGTFLIEQFGSWDETLHVGVQKHDSSSITLIFYRPMGSQCVVVEQFA